MAHKILMVLAYWVVFGLPFLLIWRVVKLFKTKDQPRNYYVGGVILYLAIAVWIPYAYFKRILGMDISVFPFLIPHLVGAFSGAQIKRRAVKQKKLG